MSLEHATEIVKILSEKLTKLKSVYEDGTEPLFKKDKIMIDKIENFSEEIEGILDDSEAGFRAAKNIIDKRDNIYALADQEVAEKKAAAAAECENSISAARAEAEKTLSDANQEAAEIRLNAQTEYEQKIAAANDKAELIIAEATQKAKDLVDTNAITIRANQQAQTIVKAAETSAEDSVKKARAEIQRIASTCFGNIQQSYVELENKIAESERNLKKSHDEFLIKTGQKRS